MAGYNPFTSPTSLMEFLTGMETQSYNEREEHGNPILDYKLQQQASGKVPEFTNDPMEDMPGNLDAYYIESTKPKIQELLGLSESDYDLSTITDQIQAKQKALDLRQRALNGATELEKSQVEELGLTALQEQYNNMLSVPGVMEFDSSRSRIADIEKTILAKQQQLSSRIHKAGKDGIGGTLSKEFNDALQLAAKWDLRAEELELEERRRNGSVEKQLDDASIIRAATIKSALGGDAGVDAIAELTGTSRDAILSSGDQLLASRGGKGGAGVDPQLAKIARYYSDKGRMPTIETAFLDYTGDAQDKLFEYYGKRIPGASTEQLKALRNRGVMYGKQLIEEDIAGEADFAQLPKSLQKSRIETSTAINTRRGMDMAISELKEGIKMQSINPTSYSLDARADVGPQIKAAASALLTAVPDAFTYSSSMEEAKRKVQNAATTYANFAIANQDAPPFHEVYALMQQQMAINVNQQGRFLDTQLINSTDPSVMAQNNFVLRESMKVERIRSRYDKPKASTAQVIEAAGGAGILEELGKLRSSGVQDFQSIGAPQGPAPAPAQEQRGLNISELARAFVNNLSSTRGDIPVVPNSIPGFDPPAPPSGLGIDLDQLPKGLPMEERVSLTFLPPDILAILERNGVDLSQPVPINAALQIKEATSSPSFDINDPTAGRKLQYILNSADATLRIQ